MAKRKGFTLIELLVVVAIIGVLAALAIGATIRFIQTQKETNTRTTIESLDKVLQKYWGKVIADAKKEPSSNISATVMTMANNDPALARIIWIKMRLMEAFPVTFTECNVLTNPLYTGGYIPTSSARKCIASIQRDIVSGSKSTPAESAACLLAALKVGDATIQDSIASNLGQDANGNKYIIDGWGNPVLFYRFPTPDLSTWTSLGGMDPQSNNPAAKTTLGKSFGADPADPEGSLQNPNWNNGGVGVLLFEQICHPVHNSAGPFAWYITPVIASAGSDGKAGLTSPAYNSLTNPNPFSINNAAQAGDNIYNYLLRFGATGN
jgi:prepilin-type N-terminal cleavage/methylation domain-containing protein